MPEIKPKWCRRMIKEMRRWRNSVMMMMKGKKRSIKKQRKNNVYKAILFSTPYITK
jgi:hypothetical protein